MTVNSKKTQKPTTRDLRLRHLLLEGSGDPAFHRLAVLAAQVLDTPVALITILDSDRQYFKSCLGLPEPWQTWQETPLTHSFCRHAVESGAPLVVEDARVHPLVRDNPAIRDLNVVAYLGIPLLLPASSVAGTFCVIDIKPRKWTPREIEILQGLTAGVVTEIELRLAALEAQEQASTARREQFEKELVQEARREAESSLALLDTIYLNAPIGLALIAPDQRITRVNAAAAQATGLAVEELLDQRLADVAPSVWDQIEPAFHQAGQSDTSAKLEIYTCNAAKAPQVWLATLSAVRSRTGDNQGVSLTLVEITALREAIRRLSESEQRYRSLFDRNPDAVFAFNPDGRFVAANPACERISGFSPAELLQFNWMDLVVPERLPLEQEHFRKVLSGEVQYVETAITHRLGHRVDLRVVAVPMLVGDRIEGVFGIAEDITDFRRAQAQLEQQARLLDLTLDPVLAWEPDGAIVFWNRGAEQLYSYRREEALHQSTHTLLQSTRPDGTPFDAARVLENGEWHGELRRRTQAGRELVVESHQLVIREPQGRLLILESNRDITSQREAEERLRLQNRALVQLAKSSALTSGNLTQALDLITSVAAQTLNVQRVGIWCFDASRSLLCCETLYEQEHHRHSTAQSISVSVYPRYFEALDGSRVIAARDAPHDPRTSELHENYLRPLHIGAMLDAPIHLRGQVTGAICFEHVGGPRRWSIEEQNFAAGIADLAAMAYEHAERRRAEMALDEAREQLLRTEVDKKRFTREILRAVTQGKLHLVDATDIPEEGKWLCRLDLSKPTNYALFRKRLRERAHEEGMPENRLEDVVLASGEVITNAIKHGEGGRAMFRVTSGKMVVRVSDRGPGIRTEDLPATVLEAGYSTKISLGVGFTLLLELVDAIWLATGPTGTTIQFEKLLAEGEPVDPVAALLARFAGSLETA